MVMVMIMSNKRKPSLMPRSPYNALTMIGDFNVITVSNSDNGLHLVRVTTARLDGRMPEILELELWRMVSLWMFQIFSFRYIFTCLDLGPVQMASAWVLPPSETSQVEVEFPHVTDPTNDYHMVLIRCGTYGFLPLRILKGYLIVVILLYSCTGLCSTGGLHLKRGIMYWHGCTLRVQGQVSPASYRRVAKSLRSLAIILPLNHSTVLTSTFATITRDIPSYEAIHGRMHLHEFGNPTTIRGLQ
jgi:hypothetical protein